MTERERESEARVRRGAQPLKFPEPWVDRPQLNPAEEAVFEEFVRFSRFCADPRPQDALAWFELRSISRAEWPWLSDVFGAMSMALRKKANDG